MLIDMGRKEPMEQPVEGKSKEPKITYPSLSIKGDKIPEELKDAKLLTMFRCEIIVKKIGDDIVTYDEGEPRRVELEIHKLGYIGKAGKLSKEEYLSASEEEREKNDKETADLKKESEEEGEE